MNIYTIELNLNIYTLFFAVTKVTAPQGSTFHLVLSIGDLKVTLMSPKTSSKNFTIPYKISKEVTNSPEGSSSYRSCVAQINFLDGESTTATGSVRIKPDDFINAPAIDIKEYDIPVPNIDKVSIFIGMSLKNDGASPSDCDNYTDSAKVISTKSRQNQSDSSSNHSHHRSSQFQLTQWKVQKK